jgi:hypothetical protein
MSINFGDVDYWSDWESCDYVFELDPSPLGVGVPPVNANLRLPMNDGCCDRAEPEGAGPFTHLLVDVQANIVKAGLYYITGELRNSSGAPIAWANAYGPYEVDPVAVIPLAFKGSDIANSGASGPYGVWIMLQDYSGSPQADTFYTTNFYNASQFQIAPYVPAATFVTGAHSDRGVDTDYECTFEYLRLDVVLNVTRRGPLAVWVDLRTPTAKPLGTAWGRAYMYEGLRTVPVLFRSEPIVRARENGPYAAALNLSEEDTGTYLGGASYTTQFYKWDQFRGGGTGPRAWAPESCNGYDDDCDGRVDEDVIGAACTNTRCQQGRAGFVRSCVNGVVDCPSVADTIAQELAWFAP